LLTATEKLGVTAGTQIHHGTSASAWTWGCPGVQHERGRRRKHTAPAQKSTARRPIPRTATAALKSTSGSGAPARRGTTVLRREGQHPSKNNRATRHDTAGASQEGDQGERKKSTAAVVLTMGRQCRRCRLGEEGLAGEVDVHGDGLPRVQLLAPGPCSALPA
jgi:hypothetical protein